MNNDQKQIAEYLEDKWAIFLLGNRDEYFCHDMPLKQFMGDVDSPMIRNAIEEIKEQGITPNGIGFTINCDKNPESIKVIIFNTGNMVFGGLDGRRYNLSYADNNELMMTPDGGNIFIKTKWHDIVGGSPNTVMKIEEPTFTEMDYESLEDEDEDEDIPFPHADMIVQDE